VSRRPEHRSTHEIVEDSASTIVGVPRRSWARPAPALGAESRERRFLWTLSAPPGNTVLPARGNDRLRTTGGEQHSPAARPSQPAVRLRC